jgi:hypothetical protein
VSPSTVLCSFECGKYLCENIFHIVGVSSFTIPKDWTYVTSYTDVLCNAILNFDRRVAPVIENILSRHILQSASMELLIHTKKTRSNTESAQLLVAFVILGLLGMWVNACMIPKRGTQFSNMQTKSSLLEMLIHYSLSQYFSSYSSISFCEKPKKIFQLEFRLENQHLSNNKEITWEATKVSSFRSNEPSRPNSLPISSYYWKEHYIHIDIRFLLYSNSLLS